MEDGHARYSVIDGQQRLTAIYDFFENKYALTGLEVLEKLNDSYYKDLPPFLIRRLEERSIRCLRIDSTLDQQVKYDIFERLNSGSVKLEAQELRNATCRGKFNELIKILSKSSDYRELISLSDAREKKMEDEELILRYFSLTYQDGYKDYKSGFKKFLTTKMVDFNNFNDSQLESMEKEFNDIIAFVKEIANGDKPFAKYRFVDGKLEFMSNFNAAVFDAVMYLSKLALINNKKVKLQDIRNLFSDADFFSSCEGSVNDISKIITRITKAAELVR
ncbi:GmrSD restriction endonuclease domain-containing protein [Aeromonas veronii]